MSVSAQISFSFKTLLCRANYNQAIEKFKFSRHPREGRRPKPWFSGKA